MQEIQQILSQQRQNQDEQTLIELGLSDVKLRVNNKFWLNALENKFGNISLLKTYRDDPNINWFYMYQKYAQQELAIHGNNGYQEVSAEDPETKGTSFILPFPTIQVFIPFALSSVMLLSLSGKIYLSEYDMDDERVFNELTYVDVEENISHRQGKDIIPKPLKLPHKIQKVVPLKECIFLLTEDYELYGLDLNEGEFSDYRKIDLNFKISDITGNEFYCIVYDTDPTKFAVVEGYFYEEKNLVGYKIREYTNVTQIKQIVAAHSGILILDIHGRVYNMFDNDYGQVGHSSLGGINCLNYKFKVKKIYSIGSMSYLQDTLDNIYKLGSGHYLYPELTSPPYKVRNIVGNNRFMIMYSKFDDFIFEGRLQREDIEDYNPLLDSEGMIDTYDKSIAIQFPALITLKHDVNTRDFTYDMFTSVGGGRENDSVHSVVLTYGVIEEDDYFLKMHPEILEENTISTPDYVIKDIGGRRYLYTRFTDDGDLFRIRMK